MVLLLMKRSKYFRLLANTRTVKEEKVTNLYACYFQYYKYCLGDDDAFMDDGEVALQDPCQKNKQIVCPEVKVHIIKFETFINLNIKVPNVHTVLLVNSEMNTAQCHICNTSFHPNELKVRCYCGNIFCFDCHCHICRGGVVI